MGKFVAGVFVDSSGKVRLPQHQLLVGAAPLVGVNKNPVKPMFFRGYNSIFS